MTQLKTLAEIGVKEGDLLRHEYGLLYRVCRRGNVLALRAEKNGAWGVDVEENEQRYTLVSRANESSMKIEEGKYYRTRDGRKAGPVTVATDDTYYYCYGHVDGSRAIRVWQKDGTHGSLAVPREKDIDLVAEWSDAPTLWRDLTPAEKGALLLAKHERKSIEIYPIIETGKGWLPADGAMFKDVWLSDRAYRIKPESTVEVVTLYGSTGCYDTYEGTGDTHRIKLTFRDGIVDSIAKVEKL